MAISIGQRDEDIEGIPRQREKIVGFRAFTADARHGPSLAVRAIAINGIVNRMRHGGFGYSRFRRTSANDSVPAKRASSASMRARTSSSVAMPPSAAMTTLLSAGGHR